MRITKILVAGLASAMVLGACSSSGGSSASGGSSSTTAPTDPSTLVVRTATSTQNVVNRLVAEFKKTQPGAKVVVTTSDQKALTKAATTGAAGITVVPDAWIDGAKAVKNESFGRSLAVIAVPSDNPSGVTDVKAFAPKSGLETAVCGPDSPIGNFGALVLSKSKITPSSDVVSGKADCSSNALGKLADHKLDAALMFRTDLKVPSGVKLLTIPTAQNVIIPISYVSGGNSAPTTGFATFLASAPAQQILTDNGYLP